MNVELDGIALIENVIDDETGVSKHLRSVHDISIIENRSIVEHKIPGMQGGILQDMGREPMEINFKGVVLGEEARESLELLRSKFKSGVPVQILSDMTGIAEITQALISDFYFEEDEGFKHQYRYSIQLSEYFEPPREDDPPPSQEEEAEEEAEEAADDAEESVNYVTGKVIDLEDNPQVGVTVKITWDGGEYTVQTDEEGIYQKDGLDPGIYTVTVDAPGYEELTEEVEIKP